MRIKAVAWNMNQRSPGGNWATLGSDSELADADVFLLSEATHLDSIPEAIGLQAEGNGSTRGVGCRCPEPPHCEKRRYSTAVAVRPISQDGARHRWVQQLTHPASSRPGAWTAARVHIKDIVITSIVVYGVLDLPSYAASVRCSLEEIQPILDDEELSRLLVLGGDFNILAGKAPGQQHHPGLRVLDDIKTRGLIDCLEAKLPADRYEDLARRTDMDHCSCGNTATCTHTRTFLMKSRPEIPYQDDYLFASADLMRDLADVTCHAQRLDADSPSDHAPVIATFEV